MLEQVFENFNTQTGELLRVWYEVLLFMSENLQELTTTTGVARVIVNCHKCKDPTNE